MTPEQRAEGRRLTDLEVRQLRDMHADENYTIRSPLCVEVCDELLRLRAKIADPDEIAREAVREFAIKLVAAWEVAKANVEAQYGATSDSPYDAHNRALSAIANTFEAAMACVEIYVPGVRSPRGVTLDETH